MRICGGRLGQSLRSSCVGDVQRAVVARIVLVDADRRRRWERTLSVAMQLHLRKCGETWGSVDSCWKWRRGGHSRVARAVARDRYAHANLELALQLADALAKARNH